MAWTAGNRKLIIYEGKMFFKHIYEKGLAHASYLVGCQATGEAIVIDPKRDIDDYLQIAVQEKLKITHVTETHIHADFLSGTRELANATGANVLLSGEGGEDWKYAYEHKQLMNGDVFNVGNLRFEVMHTPGHTPEHISFLLTDTAASSKPVMIFTGDFIFVGDVGRPDLLEEAAGYTGTSEIGAKQMFESIKKFKKLPDFVQVWPAHGAGSACGKALGAVPSSTVGYEKIVNWALNISDESNFVKKLLDGQPEPPKYFSMMKKLNKAGADLLNGIPQPAKLSVNQLKEALEKKITLVDTRNKNTFAEGHIPGSLNIQNNSAFSTWAGWMLNYDQQFLLIADDNSINDLTRKLIRIGLDNIYGYFNNIDAWTDESHKLEFVNQISTCDLKGKIDTGEDFEIIDVRGKTEFEEGHINGSRNIHAGFIGDSLDTLDTESEYILSCAGGDRSSTALSLLLKHGFKNVYNLTGGYNAWKVEHANCNKTKETVEAV